MPTEISARFLTESLKLPSGYRARREAENHIYDGLVRRAGNISTAAVELGVGRATLNRWIASNDFLAKHLQTARKSGTQ
jgi:transcriptional regulator of acetoin/glycerol metabolism